MLSAIFKHYKPFVVNDCTVHMAVDFNIVVDNITHYEIKSNYKIINTHRLYYTLYLESNINEITSIFKIFFG